MQTPFNLIQLRELRRHGKSPGLPVFLTNRHDWTAQFGAMSIYVKNSDSEQDWQAVAGLDVILDLPQTPGWTPLMKSVREAHPRRLRVLGAAGLSTMWGTL